MGGLAERKGGAPRGIPAQAESPARTRPIPGSRCSHPNPPAPPLPTHTVGIPGPGHTALAGCGRPLAAKGP